MHTQRIERCAQHILVLIERCGFEAFLHSGTDSKRHYMPAAVRGIGVETFIENNNQDAILLESGIIEQRADIVLEPCIGSGELYVLVHPVGAVGQSCALWFWFGTTKE